MAVNNYGNHPVMTNYLSNAAKNCTFTVLLCLAALYVGAQTTDEPVKNKQKPKIQPSTAILFSPVYTAQFPYGNMRDRFGFNSLFGFGVTFKLPKNWLLGPEGNFLFGTRVRENYILDNISTTTGQFVSQNNDLITVRLQEQGFNVKLNVGKIIPFSAKFPDAGLLLLTGIGLLQHKIAINVRETSLPQLSKTYRKGYDRMANGPVISQFVGGIFLDRKRFISMYGGLQFDVGFTQHRRNYDFYSQSKLTGTRLDMFLGIKVGWIIPYFIQASPREEYFYY